MRKTVMMLLGSIPVMGRTAEFLVDGAWPDPSRAALEQFVLALAEKVDAIYDRLEIKQRLERPHSTAVLSHAMSLASRSFGERKRLALRNVTINGIFHAPNNPSLAALALNAMERLTDDHIVMLEHVGDKDQNAKHPALWKDLTIFDVPIERDTGGMAKPREVFPEDDKGRRFVDDALIEVNEIIRDDLENIGLIQKGHALNITTGIL